jgi:hypothetical protein
MTDNTPAVEHGMAAVRVMRRAARSAAVLAALSIAVSVPVSARTATARCPGVRTAQGWATVNPPVSGASPTGGSGSISMYVVDSDDPLHLLVVPDDRHEVFRSVDGGCTWGSVYSIPPAWIASSAASLQIGALREAINGHQHYGYITLVAGSGATAPQAPVLLIRSTDDGATWTQATAPESVGSLPMCSASTIATTDADPLRIFLDCYRGSASLASAAPAADAAVGCQEVMFVSVDGGANWRQLPSRGFSTGCPLAGKPALLASPADPKLLWAASWAFAGGAPQLVVQESADGGSTWQAVLRSARFGIAGIGLSVAARSHGPSVVAWTSFGLFLSNDGGRRWSPIGVPGITDETGAVEGVAFNTGTSNLTVFVQRGTGGCGQTQAAWKRDLHGHWAALRAPSTSPLSSSMSLADASTAGGHFFVRVNVRQAGDASCSGPTVQYLLRSLP